MKNWNMICFCCFIIFFAILVYEKHSGTLFLPFKILIWLLWSWQVWLKLSKFWNHDLELLYKTNIKILIFGCSRTILDFEMIKTVSRRPILNWVSKWVVEYENRIKKTHAQGWRQPRTTCRFWPCKLMQSFE